jgi:hypothetical protein
MMHYRIITILSILIFVSGCSSTKIKSPGANETIKPSQTFVVEIDDQADPDTLKVTVNYIDVTDRFEPKPFIAGATVTAPPMPATIFAQGFDESYIEAYADWINAPLGGAFSSKTQGKDFNTQSLVLQAVDESIIICEINCAYGIKEGQTVEITVLLPEAPLQNTEVTVHPGTRDISLNNAAAGQNIIAVIPNNDRRVVFTIRGITPTGNDIREWSSVSVSTPNTHGYSHRVRVFQ